MNHPPRIDQYVGGEMIVKFLVSFHPLRIGQYVGGESPPRIDQYVGGKTHMLMKIYDSSNFKSSYGLKNVYDFKE